MRLPALSLLRFLGQRNATGLCILMGLLNVLWTRNCSLWPCLCVSCSEFFLGVYACKATQMDS
jgi:hypothetical protein